MNDQIYYNYNRFNASIYSQLQYMEKERNVFENYVLLRVKVSFNFPFRIKLQYYHLHTYLKK